MQVMGEGGREGRGGGSEGGGEGTRGGGGVVVVGKEGGEGGHGSCYGYIMGTRGRNRRPRDCLHGCFCDQVELGHGIRGGFAATHPQSLVKTAGRGGGGGGRQQSPAHSATLLPDGKAPMVPLMRIFLC